MKTTKIVIKNLFGIKETELDGRSVEISGPKGSGKTSVLDSIRYALTNRSDRDYIVHRGADEGEILIETDTGLSIDRKALPAKSAGTVKVRDGSLLQTRPAEFLSQIFTPLQLNPVEFTQLSRQEKNRVILNLIEFAWDTNWIREQFGEIPQGVDYSKHILEVLHDIQAENGVYFQSRQNINRDIRNKQAFVSDIAKDIPSGYDFDHWNTYPIGEKYRELESLKEQNNVIERARAFRNSHEAKLRGLEGQRDLDIAAIDRKTSEDRTRLTADIERLKAEIRLYEERLAGLDERREESVRVVISSFNEKKAKLERDAGIADQYIGRELADTTALSKEIDTAEANIGLRAHAVVTDSEVIAAAEQKELRGWSFGFVKQKDHWKTDEEGTRRRFVDELELREVSILDKTPAYIATSIETRDDDEILVEFRADQPLEDGVDYIRQTESATETKTTTLTPGDESVMFCAQKTVEIYKMRRRM